MFANKPRNKHILFLVIANVQFTHTHTHTHRFGGKGKGEKLRTGGSSLGLQLSSTAK